MKMWMKKWMKRFNRISIRKQFIIYFVVIAVTIGGSSMFILQQNAKVVEKHERYLTYISKIIRVSALKNENGRLLQEILLYYKEEDITDLHENIELSLELIEELLMDSPSIDISVRFRIVNFLYKRFESQTEWMLRLRRLEKVEGEDIDYDSTYYQVYLNLLELINQMESQIREALKETSQANITSVGKIKASNEILQRGLLVIVFVILGLAVFFYFAIANYITRLIHNILEMTKQLSKEEHPKTLELTEGPEEVEELVARFNELLLTMDSLHQKAEERKKLELELAEREVEKLKMSELLKEARLQGLQLQIQPHFLFNTLNVIAMMTMMDRTDEVYELIIALSKFLRHSLKKESSLVPLEEEIDMIYQYLYIIKARMSEQLTYEVEVDVESTHLTLPLYTLQPIVENAFKHGLEDKLGKGLLKVSIKERVRGGRRILLLRVYDNGLGMSKECLQRIRGKVNVTNIRFDQSSHIGVENVAARLWMIYEERVKYQIHSKQGTGTIFSIYIILGRGD